MRIDVEMPDCSGIDDELPEEEKDTISFGIKIHSPSPEAVKISRKDFIIINIEPDNTEEELAAARERQKMIDYFVDDKEVGWLRQFKVALMLGPTVDADNAVVTPTWDEAVFHFFGMPWQLLFATIPPRNMCGGWAAFVIALAEIGAITTVVGELATILGCTINLKVAATAITLVAGGTSLPDTSASKIAAQTSPTADSAIGNVTGSNSVNVFLGMGLPWVLGAGYWHMYFDGAAYEQPAGALAFSVMVFLGCCLVCFAVLVCRRAFVKGELGGPEPTRTITAIICFSLWIIYLVISILQIYEVFVVPESILGPAYYSCKYPLRYPNKSGESVC